MGLWWPTTEGYDAKRSDKKDEDLGAKAEV